jgi:acyl-CoA thioester hydrolase
VTPDLPTEGRIVDGRHYLPIRVYFEDTDLTGIVYHANYLRYMERARTEMLRLSGVIHTEMMAEGTGYYAVHSMNITWHRPARLDDQLVVVSRVTLVRAAATCLVHDVMRGSEMLCSATVTAAFLDMEGRPRRQSRAWHERFTLLMQQALSAQ